MKGKPVVLLVEDDESLRDLIAGHLTSSGFEVVALEDGKPAIDHVMEHGLPHIALIDLALPSGMHGFELANKLRTMADLPIIFVTATTDTEIVLQGLKHYAEDFVTKPFQMRELEARIRVVLARMPSFDYASSPTVKVDNELEVDFAHNRIIVRGRTVRLTPTETVLLHVLMRNAGRVVENRQLIDRVWQSDEVFEDTLRVHMHRLRRKIEADSHHPRYIRTDRGQGYLFTVQPESLIAPDPPHSEDLKKTNKKRK
jgi:DNA-binding response OmpR family regulator